MKKIMIDNRNGKIIAFALVAVLLLIGTVGLASALAGQTTVGGSGGLVAYYPFNGDAKDKSGNGNDGTVYGATLTADRFGNQDSAYEFDGDDYINCGNDESLAISSSITVAAWIKIDRFNDGGIVCKQSTIDGDYFLTIGCGGSAYYNNIRFGNKGLGTPIGGIDCGPASNPLELGKWYYVAGVFDDDSNKIYVYINGIFHNSEDFTGSIPTSTGDLTIGTYCGTTKYLFEGTIDDIRIYNRALSEAEIQELYGGGVPTPVTPAQSTTTAEAVITVKSPEEGARYPAGELVVVDWSAEMPTDIACWTSYVNGERRAAAERAKGPYGKRAFESYGTGYPTHTEGKEGLNVLRIEIELVDGRKYEKEVVFYIETTSTTPSTPADTPSITECDSTARAIINAVGGCDALDKSRYPAIYEACCSKITKEYLLGLLNDALADDGKITSDEKKQLLDALNAYLEMRP